MVAKDKISYNIPSDWTVGNLFDNPLTTVIKPGVDIFEKKSYLQQLKLTEQTFQLELLLSMKLVKVALTCSRQSILFGLQK